MTKKKVIIFFLINSLVCLIIGAFIPLSINNFFQKPNTDPNMEKFMEVYDIIKDEWYFLDDGDEQSYIDRALDAMVNNQNDDKYLRYYPASDEKEDTYGIGVTVTKYGGYLMISDVSMNSPASKAGLTKDLVITKVNDVDIFNMSINEVSKLISGPINTKVRLTVVDSQNKEKVYEVIRNEFQKQSVYGSVDGDIASIRITGFENGTVTQVKKYLDEFAKANSKDLIIDLRDNGGGYIYAFKEIADFFIDKDKVLGTYVHKNNSREISYTKSNVSYTYDDIYIVVNQNSASASESFTAAMMDNLDNVTVLGVNSYGKGIAQKTIAFSDGSSLKYTYAEYLRPDKNVNGGKLHEIGIQPDKIVEDKGYYKLVDTKFNSFTDAKNAYKSYLEGINNIVSEEDKLLISQGLEELEIMTNTISFSKEVSNMISRILYDERKSAYEAQMNEVKRILKED